MIPAPPEDLREAAMCYRKAALAAHNPQSPPDLQPGDSARTVQSFLAKADRMEAMAANPLLLEVRAAAAEWDNHFEANPDSTEFYVDRAKFSPAMLDMLDRMPT